MKGACILFTNCKCYFVGNPTNWLNIRDHSLFMPRGGGGGRGAGKNKESGGHAKILGQSEGGHEEMGRTREGGCLILQFCFILKKCVHCCR